MRFSPATRLSTRELEWVGYRNDGTNFNNMTAPTSHSAVIWAQQYAEIFESDAGYNACPVSGWRSRQGLKRGL
jgi:hypothetical protein